jgi:hypothetical protein
MVQKTFSAPYKSYPRFIQKDKKRIWFRKRFQPFLSHIRASSKRIKRTYGSENVFQHFMSHIRVLSKRIKRAHVSEKVFQPFISHNH